MQKILVFSRVFTSRVCDDNLQLFNILLFIVKIHEKISKLNALKKQIGQLYSARSSYAAASNLNTENQKVLKKQLPDTHHLNLCLDSSKLENTKKKKKFILGVDLM